MSIILAVLAGLFLFLLLGSALLLWLTCRLLGVARPVSGPEPGEARGYTPITYRRALGVVLVYSLGILVLNLGVYFARGMVPQGSLPWLALGSLVLQLLFLLVCCRILLGTNLLQTILVPVLWLISHAVFTLAVGVGVWFFLFRTYVIPTGSMANTLLGYHKNVTCPACALPFPINSSVEVAPPGGEPAYVHGCICPNCRKPIHFASTPEMARARWLNDHPDSRAVPDPGWTSGDRILVGGGLLGAGNFPPQRLDLVTFEYPNPEALAPEGQPARVVIYVNRLIGLPGETVAIRLGDLYLLPPEQSPFEATDPQEEGKPRNHVEYTFQNDARALKMLENEKFQILRKPPAKILALRRLVYDNDHQAKDLTNRLPPRWAASAGWQGVGSGGFASSAETDTIDWLRYQHILRGNGGKPSLITDFMGYNTWQAGVHSIPKENWVGDLMLEAEVEVKKGQGQLLLELCHGVDRFQARWDLDSGNCQLVRISGDGEEVLDSKPTSLKGAGTYQVRFANFDRKLTVWVDGRLPFDEGVVYEAPEEVRPTEENDLHRPASIGSKGAALEVRHLRLWRDTYYTAASSRESPSDGDVSGFRSDDPSNWDRVFSHPRVLTMYVQPGHYLCLGDNSPESSDGRTWGSVPSRLLLGKPLFVYYPFSRARRPR
jgi:signal peptidase I